MIAIAVAILAALLWFARSVHRAAAAAEAQRELVALLAEQARDERAIADNLDV